MLTFSHIEGTWDRPVYIIGGGPSIRGFDFSRLDGLGYRLGVNKSAWWANCDGLFTLDQHFTRMCRDQIAEFVERGGDAFLAMPPNEQGHKEIPGATYLYRRRNPGLSDKPADIFGVNSGYGALGVAYLKRAPTIALLGFDMQYDKEGRTHFHEGYSWHNKRSHRFMDRWATNFDRAAVQCEQSGIEVVNYVGTPESKITAFPTAPLEDL